MTNLQPEPVYLRSFLQDPMTLRCSRGVSLISLGEIETQYRSLSSLQSPCVLFGSYTTSSKEFHASTGDPVFYSLSSVNTLLLTTLHTILIAGRLCFHYGCNEPQDSIERLEATNTILLMELQSVVTTQIQLTIVYSRRGFRGT